MRNVRHDDRGAGCRGRREAWILGGLAGGVTLAALVLPMSGCSDTQSEPPPAERHQASDGGDPGHADEHGDHAHATGLGEESQLIVSAQPAEVVAEEPARLRLMIRRADGSTVRKFEPVHEKLVHLIVVREGLDEFAHLHPEVDGAGNITDEYTFPKGGRYLLYADHRPAGGAQATAKAGLRVSGDAPPAPALTPDVPGRVSGDGLVAGVTVEATDEETRIAFALSDESGKPVTDLEQYLGALGHLVILSADGTEYVHAHPEHGESQDGPVAFAAHFTRPGLYKGWAQFQRSGSVLTVPFVVEIR